MDAFAGQEPDEEAGRLGIGRDGLFSGNGAENKGPGLPRRQGEKWIAGLDEGEGFADEVAVPQTSDFQLTALIVHLEDPDFAAENIKERFGFLLGLEEKGPFGKGRFAADPADVVGQFVHRRVLL